MNLAKMMPKKAKEQIKQMYINEIMRIKKELENNSIPKEIKIEAPIVANPTIENIVQTLEVEKISFEKQKWDAIFEKIANEDFMKLMGG